MMKTLCRWPNKMAAMDQPRSGHGCSHLTADGGHVIVTGRHVAPSHLLPSHVATTHVTRRLPE